MPRKTAALTLDKVREKKPDLGFALYAYAPGEPVVLEVLHENGRSTYEADTEVEALAKAFPDLVEKPKPRKSRKHAKPADIFE